MAPFLSKRERKERKNNEQVCTELFPMTMIKLNRSHIQLVPRAGREDESIPTGLVVVLSYALLGGFFL